MDRTSQFASLANEAKAAAPPSGPLSLPKAQAPKLATAASHMCQQMRATASLTQELRRLAQRKGLFNDPSAQIGELAPTVRANIKSMEQQLSTFAAGLGQYSLRRNARAHWNGVLEIMKDQAVHNARRLQSALKARSQALMQQSSRREKLSAGQWVSPSALQSPLFAGAGPVQAPARPARGRATAPAQTSTEPSLVEPTASLRRRGGAGHAPPPVVSAAFPQDKYSAQKIAQHKQARARLSNARAVESTIVELGEMMGRVATLVAAQETHIDAIETEATATLDMVEAAQAEVFKYYNMVSEDRGLILKTLGVVALVIVLFMVFK